MKKILGQSWLTTAIGLVAAIVNALVPLVEKGTIDPHTVLESVTFAVLGWAAKSYNVSGAKPVDEKPVEGNESK